MFHFSVIVLIKWQKYNWFDQYACSLSTSLFSSHSTPCHSFGKWQEWQGVKCKSWTNTATRLICMLFGWMSLPLSLSLCLSFFLSLYMPFFHLLSSHDPSLSPTALVLSLSLPLHPYLQCIYRQRVPVAYYCRCMGENNKLPFKPVGPRLHLTVWLACFPPLNVRGKDRRRAVGYLKVCSLIFLYRLASHHMDHWRKLTVCWRALLCSLTSYLLVTMAMFWDLSQLGQRYSFKKRSNAAHTAIVLQF